MFTHVYTVTRPDTSAPFWFDTPEADNPALFDDLRDQLILSGNLISVTREDSPDGLVLTRTVVCPSETDFIIVLQTVESSFPGTYHSRIDYNFAHNHVVSIQNTTS